MRGEIQRAVFGFIRGLKHLRGISNIWEGGEGCERYDNVMRLRRSDDSESKIEIPAIRQVNSARFWFRNTFGSITFSSFRLSKEPVNVPIT